jgi:hypothetical protein
VGADALSNSLSGLLKKRRGWGAWGLVCIFVGEKTASERDDDERAAAARRRRGLPKSQENAAACRERKKNNEQNFFTETKKPSSSSSSALFLLDRPPDLGKVGQDVGAAGRREVVGQVLHGALAGHDGLRAEAQHGEHGEAAFCFLVLFLGGVLVLVFVWWFVKRAGR